MHGSFSDGMRFLGADHTKPASEIERLLMIKLHNRIDRARARAMKKATAGG